MDLRTKLVFALVGVTLGSMLALGAAGFTQARDLLRDAALRQLDALAESRQHDLQNVTRGWSERVQLIGSRTQLRLSLAAFGDPGRAATRAVERERVARILEDAREAAGSVRFLGVLDASGAPVASAGERAGDDPTGAGALPVVATAGEGLHPPRLVDVSVDASGRPEVRYVMELRLDEATVGTLIVRMDADELVAIARDHTGLGETGETLIVQAAGDSARLLHPTRHGDLAAAVRVPADAASPLRLALAERDTVVWRGAVDYRGESVWAATRYLPGPEWGIVVKVDASEQGRPILDLRGRMVRLALSLAAFAILAGIALGLHLSRPLHELADVANRIRQGEMDARAPVRAQDEVGMLARTFNRMADALTARHLSLAEERTPAPDETPAHPPAGEPPAGR